MRKVNHENTVQENINKRKQDSKSSGTIEQIKEKSKYYEDFMMKTYKETESKLSNSITTRENLRKKICELKEEIQFYYTTLDKYKHIVGNAIKSHVYYSKSKSDVSSYLIAKQNFKDTINRERLEVQQHIEMLQIEITQISRDLFEYDENTSKLRKELRIVKNELILHYSELLKEGKDTRSEGLS